MNQIVGHCPKCGAPIYAPMNWQSITPPPSIYSCACNGLRSNRNGADEMITQDEAIQMARELTALCNKVRTQTLLEAAEYVSRNLMSPREYAEELRRMAGVSDA